MIDPEDLARQRQVLGPMLRDLRRQARLSGARLAERTLMSQSKISRIELGRRLPTVTDVERIARACQAPADVVKQLVQMAKAANTSYRPARRGERHGAHHKQGELRAFEAAARRLRYFLPAIPTGLLHTREYAMTTLLGLGKLTPEVCEKIVAGRVVRQEVMLSSSCSYEFLLTEQAVRARVAPLHVMAGQCAHMAELAQRPNIEISVLAFAADWPVMPLNTFVIYDERFVTAELFSGEVLLHDPLDVEQHVSLFTRMRSRALQGADAVAFLSATAALYRAGAGHGAGVDPFMPERE